MFINVSEESALSFFRVEEISSTPKMEAVYSSETLANIYYTTWYHISEDSNLHGIAYFTCLQKGPQNSVSLL
jgi:hypothetical protein